MNEFDQAVINKENRVKEFEDLLLRMVKEIQWCMSVGLYMDQESKKDPIMRAQKRAVFVLLRRLLKQVIRSFDVEW